MITIKNTLCLHYRVSHSTCIRIVSFSFFVIPFVIIVKKFAPLIIPDCSFVQLPKLEGGGLKSARDEWSGA